MLDRSTRDTEEKKAEKSAEGESVLAQAVVVLGVTIFFALYLTFQFAFGWVIEILPEWIYYTLVGVGLLIWVGDLLSKVSDWMERDLARMDAKTKAERVRLQEAMEKKDV